MIPPAMVYVTNGVKGFSDQHHLLLALCLPTIDCACIEVLFTIENNNILTSSQKLIFFHTCKENNASDGKRLHHIKEGILKRKKQRSCSVRNLDRFQSKV